MKHILAAFMAFMFSLVLSQPADAGYIGKENARGLAHINAVELTVYAFDNFGRYVELDYQYHYLNRPSSEQDLANQLSWFESHSKSKYSGRVFVEANFLDQDDDILYESVNSFMPQRTKRKGKWTLQTPEWGAGDFYLDPVEWGNYDGSGYSYVYDDPKVKKLAKAWSVDIYFDWVQVEGIEQIDPDLHKYVDVLSLAPEWDYHPAIETVVHSSGGVKLYARSHSGFRPIWVNITTYDDLFSGASPIISKPYADEMFVNGGDDENGDKRKLVPGELIVIEFLFDQDPVDQVGGGKD